MLYPQNNALRGVIDLSGMWDFRFAAAPDDDHARGFDGGRIIAVPSSWNELYEDDRDNLGPAWYQTRFARPMGWARLRCFLRFNSVNYDADVWLNGYKLGGHEGGHLPFAFEVTDYLEDEDNLLVVRVDGRLAFDHVPPGDVPGSAASLWNSYPPTKFDFFPYCGIQRPVLLYAVPPTAIEDLTVITDLDGQDGIVRVRVETNAPAPCRLSLRGHGANISAAADAPGETALTIPDVKAWGIGTPNLYDLTAELLDMDSRRVIDRYTLPVGVRTIRVEGDRLLLNGEPIYLKGFGRHEDFPVTGRGYQPGVIVKDHALMAWVGANSYRTTHYPYSEQQMDHADRLGMLVIDEIPAVGLYFDDAGVERRLEVCKQQMRELIDRDKNHPSVILWSAANEPATGGKHPETAPFFRTLYDLAKRLDPSRPVTLVSSTGLDEESFAFMDVVCINRYFGWYMSNGQIDAGMERLAADLDALHARYPKPVILSEFGADAVAGMHSQPPEMFSEEYQAELIVKTIAVARSRPYIVGEHVWNFADFKTGQNVLRVGGLNLKGVFTRDRRPKLAAHRLRELWTRDQDSEFRD